MQFFRMKQQFYRNKNETINTNDTLKLEFMMPKIKHRDTNANGSQGWNILKCNILHDCLNPSWVCWVDTAGLTLAFSCVNKNRCVICDFSSKDWHMTCFVFRFMVMLRRVLVQVTERKRGRNHREGKEANRTSTQIIIIKSMNCLCLWDKPPML